MRGDTFHERRPEHHRCLRLEAARLCLRSHGCPLLALLGGGETLSDDDALAAVATLRPGAQPIATTLVAVVSQEGISWLTFTYEPPGPDHVGPRFNQWVAANHPEATGLANGHPSRRPGSRANFAPSLSRSGWRTSRQTAAPSATTAEGAQVGGTPELRPELSDHSTRVCTWVPRHHGQ